MGRWREDSVAGSGELSTDVSSGYNFRGRIWRRKDENRESLRFVQGDVGTSGSHRLLIIGATTGLRLEHGDSVLSDCVQGGHGLGVGLVGLLRDDHLGELSRDVDVRRFSGATGDGAASAGSRDSHAG